MRKNLKINLLQQTVILMLTKAQANPPTYLRAIPIVPPQTDQTWKLAMAVSPI